MIKASSIPLHALSSVVIHSAVLFPRIVARPVYPIAKWPQKRIDLLALSSASDPSGQVSLRSAA
jgi:hypothetical protein